MRITVRGFVVAGGRSSRMGQDKALLPYGGSTLLELAIAKIRAVTDAIRILCGPSRRYEDFGAPIVEDAVCGVGPLAGWSPLFSPPRWCPPLCWPGSLTNSIARRSR